MYVWSRRASLPFFSSSTMFGLPAAARNVGNQSSPDMIPFSTLPAGTLPGQRTMQGTRKPPSSTVPLPPANGVWPPSGQVKFSAPLSVVKTTIVLSSRPASFELLHDRADDVVELRHAGLVDGPAVLGVAHLLVLLGEVRDDVHARRVQPEEERLAVALGLVDELGRVVEDLVVDRLHALGVERAGVLDLLLADLAPARMHGRVVLVASPSSGAGCAGRPCPSAPADSSGGTGPPSRRGGRGSRRTRRSRARSAGTRCGRRGGSCRTGRWRSPSP